MQGDVVVPKLERQDHAFLRRQTGDGRSRLTAQVIGEGEAWVFSAGKVATGTWHKPDGKSPTTYRDQQGGEIVLSPGTTWIALPYGPGSSFG